MFPFAFRVELGTITASELQLRHRLVKDQSPALLAELGIRVTATATRPDLGLVAVDVAQNAELAEQALVAHFDFDNFQVRVMEFHPVPPMTTTPPNTTAPPNP